MSAAPDRELALFTTCRRMRPDQRASYLDASCAGDRALRQRVEDLLRADETAGRFLQALVPDPEPSPGSAPTPERCAFVSSTVTPSEKEGDRIGRYKLLQVLGEGGCGVVFLAEQEAPIHRRVALKLIKAGMDTKQVIARFAAERQALALMDHPNIAKVLDAGATPSGRPYFVMELVRGPKLTDYCDQNQLSTDARLELCVQVCRAVHHAHQKGIIHRDLKPSNVLVSLVDGVAVPKVIDFGIAKATQGRLTDQTLFTALEQFLGTPAYMSPEQADLGSLDIDCRSDVYSLGVLLYELLTGTTPFAARQLLQAGLDEMRRVVREQDPPRPSARLRLLAPEELTAIAHQRQATPPRLLRALRGDVDWILLKCLEKSRSRRYDTVRDLALDLERHLDRQPVLARPPRTLYRLQKLIRRHQLVVTAVAAVLAGLMLGLALAGWLGLRARRHPPRLQSDPTVNLLAPGPSPTIP